MRLDTYGYRRMTTALDPLLTREGLAAFKPRRLGLGWGVFPILLGGGSRAFPRGASIPRSQTRAFALPPPQEAAE